MFVHFLGPFELIDGNGDGNITRDEWQEKIELAMDKVMDITNVTMAEDYEDLYDNIWEALDCDNGTNIDIEVKSRTTDAQRGNSLHCMAENSLPLPNS